MPWTANHLLRSNTFTVAHRSTALTTNGITNEPTPSVARSSTGTSSQYSAVFSAANTRATSGGAHFFANTTFSFFLAANQNTSVNTTSRTPSLIRIALISQSLT